MPAPGATRDTPGTERPMRENRWTAQVANVGVGIIGLEGTQAVRASDFAFKEFKYASLRGRRFAEQLARPFVPSQSLTVRCRAPCPPTPTGRCAASLPCMAATRTCAWRSSSTTHSTRTWRSSLSSFGLASSRHGPLR